MTNSYCGKSVYRRITDTFRFYFPKKRIRRHRKFTSEFDFSINVCHTNEDNSYLTQLCDEYGTDKGGSIQNGGNFTWPVHAYTDYYDRMFKQCRHRVTAVLECGIGIDHPGRASDDEITGKPGASLRVWRDYFPNAIVIGLDINPDVLFEEERIKTYQVDQTDSENIKQMWTNIPIEKFDIIIDDGLHNFQAAVCLFENSIANLADDGFYVIEDMSLSDLSRLRNYFKGTDYQVDFVTIHQHANPKENRGNSLVVIRK